MTPKTPPWWRQPPALIGLGLFLFVLALFCKQPFVNGVLYRPQNGDLIFQSLPPYNDLVVAISGITDSPYSHCGLVEKRDGDWYVLEAYGNVHRTPLAEWMRRGQDQGVTVYRCDLSDAERTKILAAAAEDLGKPYDSSYELDETKIYCSELIWRAFRKAAQWEPGKLERLGDLHWQPYEATIRKFAAGELPLERRIISPVSLTRDRRFKQVFDSF